MFARGWSVADGSPGRLAARAGTNPREADHRIICEALEPRQMLAVALWTGAGDGTQWSNPNNWLVDLELVRVPEAGDDVVLDESGMYASSEVQFTGDATIASLTATAAGLTFSSGTLTVTGDMTISRPGPNWSLILESGATVHAGSITGTNVILGSAAGSNLLSSGQISISGNNVQTVFGTVHGLGGVNLGGPNSALNMGASGVINGGSGDVVIGANGDGYADVGGTLIGNVITINTGETALNTAVVNAASNLVFNVPNAITGFDFGGMSINTPLITLAGAGGVGAAGSLDIRGSNNQIGGVTGSVGAIPSLRTKVTLGVSNLTLTGTAGFTSINGAGINLFNVTGFTDLTIAAEGAVQVDGSVSGGSMSVASQGAVQIVGTVSGDSLSVVAPSVDVIGTNLSLTANLYVDTADGFLVGSLVSASLMEFVGAVESNSSTLTAATRLRLVGTFQQVGGSIITPRVELMGGSGMVYHLSSPDNEIAVFAGDLHPNHHYIDSGLVVTSGDLVIEGFVGGVLDVSARSVTQTDRIQVLALKVRAENDVVLDNVLNGLVAASVLPRVGTLASVVLATGEGNTSLVVDQDNHGIQAGFVRLIGIGFTSPAGSNFGAIVASTLFLEGPGSFNLESDANAVDELHAAVGGSVIYRSNVQGVDLVPRGGDPFSVAGDLTISVIGNELATSTDVIVGGTMLLSATQISQNGGITAATTAIGTGTDTTLTVQTNSFNGFIDGDLDLTLIPLTNPDGLSLDSFGGGGFGLLTFGDATITVAGNATLVINAGINTHGGDLSINTRDVGFPASPFNFLLSANLDLNLTGVGLPSFLQGGDINVASLSGFVAGTLVLQDVDGLTLGRAGSGFTVQTLELSTLAVNQPASVFQSGPLTAGSLVFAVEGGVELTDAANSVGSITGSVFEVFRYGSDAPGALVLDMGSASTIGVGVNLTNPLSSLSVVHASGSAGVDLRAGAINGVNISGDGAALVAHSGSIVVSDVHVNRVAAQALVNITIATTSNTLVDAADLFFGQGAVNGLVAGGDVSLTFDHSSDVQSRIIAQNLYITMLAGNLTTLGSATVTVPGLFHIEAPSGSGVLFDEGVVNVGAFSVNAPDSHISLVEADDVIVSSVSARVFELVAGGGVVVGGIGASDSVYVEAGAGPTGGNLTLGNITAPYVGLAVAVNLGNGAVTLFANSVVSDSLYVDAADLSIYGSPEFGEISASGNVHLFENSRITIRTHAYFNAPGSVLTLVGNAGLYAGANTNDSSININRIESEFGADGGTLDLFTSGILRITGGTIGQPSVLNGDPLIRANNIQLDGYLTSTFNRTLFLGTYSEGIDIKIGDDSFGPPFMGLTAAEVANIGPGFGSVQVGGTAAPGGFGPRINLLGDTTWNSPTVFTASVTQDVVSYGATVRSANGAALTFNTAGGARFVVNGGTGSVIATGNVTFTGPIVLDGALNVDSSGATAPNTVRFAADINGFHAFGEIPALYVRPGFSTATQFLGSIGNTESVDVVEVGPVLLPDLLNLSTVEFGEAGEPFTPRTVYASTVRLHANVLVHSDLAINAGNGGDVRVGGNLAIDGLVSALTGSLNVLGTLSGTPGNGGAAQFYATVVGTGSAIQGNVSNLGTIQLYNYGGGDFGLPSVMDTDFNVLYGAFGAGAAGLHLVGDTNSVGGSVTTPGPITIDGYTFIGIGAQEQATTFSPGGDLVFNSDVRLLVDLDIDMTGAPSNALVRFGGAVDSYHPSFPQSLSVVQGNAGVVRFEGQVGAYAALGSIHIAAVPPPDFMNLPLVEFGASGSGAGVSVSASSVFLASRVSAHQDVTFGVGSVFVLGRVIGNGTNTLVVQANDAVLLDGIDNFNVAFLAASGTFQIGYNVAATTLVLTGNFVELNGVGLLFRGSSIILNGAVISSSGDITFDGPVALAGDSQACASVGHTVEFLSTIALNGFHFVICGDEINFYGKVTGPGTLDLRQATPDITINFLYTPSGRASLLSDPTTDPVPGELDITPTEYSLLDPTITVVVVGSSSGSPTVEIGEVNLTSTTTVNATSSGGKVRIRGDVRGTGGSGVTINGSFTTTELYASIMLSGGGLTINDAVKVFVPAAHLTTNEGAPGGAPLLIVGGVNSDAGMTNALQIAAGGSTVELQGSVGGTPGGLLGSLQVQAGNTTISGSEVNTSGPQVYDTPVVVQGSVTISTIGAPVNFNNTVMGGGGADLTVAPGTGEVQFAAAVTLASVEINTGNNRTFSAPVVIGVLDVLGGEVAFNAPATILSGSFSGGSITGSGDVVITGLFTWSGGTFSGSGGVMVAASGELAIVDGGFKSLERMLVNGGLVTWQSGNVAVNGATLTNQGELRISADGGTFSGLGTIDNTGGVIRRTGNDGTSTIEGLTVLNGVGGQVIVEQGVLLILPPAPPARTGEAFVRSAGQTLLVNDGQIMVGPRGTLRLAGDFGQSGGGTLVALIEGPSSFGQLVVDGVAMLDGGLELRYVNGYDPAVLDPFAAARWSVLVAGQTVGQFSRIDSPALPPRRVLYVTYTDGGVEFLYTHICDTNRDGLLNPDDLGDFITEYFTPVEFLDPNSKIDRDFNHDGVVDPDDLGDFVMNYYADYLRP